MKHALALELLARFTLQLANYNILFTSCSTFIGGIPALHNYNTQSITFPEQ